MARSGSTPNVAAPGGGGSVVVTDTPYDYPEDSGHISGAIGSFVLAVRNDAGTSLVDTTLDYAPLQVNAAGELRVTTAGGTPTGRDDTDNQAPVATGLNTNVSRTYVFDGTNWDRWTGLVQAAQSGTWTVELGATTLAALETITVLQGTSPWVVSGTVTANQGGTWTVELGATTLAALETITVLQGTSPWVIGDGGGSITVDAVDLDIRNLNFATDSVTISDGGGSVTVDGTVTADTNFDYPEDSGHTTGAPGAFVLAVRNDALTSLVDTTLDYAPLQVNSIGELRVTTSGGAATGRDDTDDQAAIATGLPVNVNRLYLWDGTNWDRAKSAGSTGVLAVGGAAAHDAPSAGNPVLLGGHAVAENGTVTNVTAADVTRLLADLKGRVYVTAKRASLLGIYHAVTPQSTITLAADAATAGRHWLINPVGSTVLVALRKVNIISESSTALITLTTPAVTYERVTFTGTASGAQVTPARRDSTDAAPTATIRTASTGLVLTAGAAICSLNVHSVLTAVGETRPVPHLWEWDEEERIVLRAGEGVVFRQGGAGTAVDARIVQSDLVWEEYTA